MAILEKHKILEKNATLLLDGNRHLPLLRGITGSSSVSQAAASMAVLPSDAAPGSHTIAVVTAAGAVSNTVVLNGADLWWAQGDEGAAATAGGWIRAFGRGLTVSTGAEAPTPPAGLVRDLSLLASAWRPEAQLAQLRTIAARYPDWLEGAAAPQGGGVPDATRGALVLTPVSGGTALSLSAEASSESPVHSLTFAVPPTVPAGEYRVALRCPSGHLSSLDFYDSPSIPRVRTMRIRANLTNAEPAVVWVEGASGINMTTHATDREPYGTAGDGRPINSTPALLAALSRAASLGRAVVKLRAGYYHVDGPIVVPHGVTIAGSGAGLTALYFSYDNVSTAPHALLSPAAANASWGLEDLTIYVLGFQ